MKTSVSLFLTDILPHKRKFLSKIIKSHMFTSGSPVTELAALKKSGIDGIELFLPLYEKYSVQDILELKHVLSTSELPILSVHQQLRFFTTTKMPEIMQLFEVAEMLSAKVIVLHMSSAGRQVFDKKYIAAIHTLQEKYGIKVGFENREKFIGSLSQPYGWDEDKFSTAMNDSNFYITLDTTHLAHSGGDIVSFFRRNKDRIVNIHISDYKYHLLNSSLRPMRYKHMALGKGQLPIEEFLRTLQEEHYKGLVTMEIHSDLAGICESARIINSIAKKSN